MHAGDRKSKNQLEAEEYKKKETKEKSAAQKALLASLFKEVTDVKLQEDGQIDFKMTLCPYFKAGVCEKGKKCKYSHDMTIEQQKVSNIDVY